MNGIMTKETCVGNAIITRGIYVLANAIIGGERQREIDSCFY